MADQLSGIGEAIKQASEAYASAIAALTKAAQNLEGLAAGSDRDRMIENWLRLARMSKDGVITAIDQGFAMWEREVRRMASSASGAAQQPANPIEAWAENWRKAMDSFGAANPMSEEFRKQAESVQKTLTDSIRSWQQLWEPAEKK